MEDPTTTTTRAEAERLLGVAEKLLQNRDLRGSRDFAILAQETEPLLDGSDQILAVTDVLLAAENRINNNQHDWYSILQIDRKSDDLDIAKKQYRRLALLLHPDKNKFPLADAAFKLVADAWAVLSNSSKKSVYDNELSYYFTKVDLVASRNNRNQAPIHRQQQHQQQNMNPHVKLPVRRTAEEKNKQKGSSFWTACPYCYILYEYPRAYDECCLRCQNCQRAFHAASIPSLPPLVPGKEAYYCCWGFFPLGFSAANSDDSVGKNAGAGKAPAAAGFPNWMPPMFSQPPQSDENAGAGKAPAAAVFPNWMPPMSSQPQPPAPQSDGNAANVNVEYPDGNASAGFDMGSNTKKRGRPRKYPIQV